MKRRLLGDLLFATSIIFYVLAVMALINRYYETMFFLIMDGLLFGAAGYFVSYRLNPEPAAQTAEKAPETDIERRAAELEKAIVEHQKLVDENIVAAIGQKKVRKAKTKKKSRPKKSKK